MLQKHMLQKVNSGGVEILIFEGEKFPVAMSRKSLESHMLKHPEIAATSEGYLSAAYEIFDEGRPYKNGKLLQGKFAAGYESEQHGCLFVTTVHTRFVAS